jgi:hypothetical protein
VNRGAAQRLVADSPFEADRENGAGEVTVYATDGMQRVDDLVFPSSAVFARFSAKRLFVLTRDQTADDDRRVWRRAGPLQDLRAPALGAWVRCGWPRRLHRLRLHRLPVAPASLTGC